MRPNFAAVASVLILSGITAALILPRGEPASRAPVPAPDVRVEQFDAWSPTLEHGGTVRLVRRLCDTQKAAHLARTGTPAPERVNAGEIVTFGPIPEARAFELAHTMDESADATLEHAEQMTVEDLAQARAQIQEVLHGLKARAAAAALRDGRYWTVEPNDHPRLPPGFTYWQFARPHTFEGDHPVDVFVPIDLRSPELAPTHDALLSLEAELRRDRADAFNRMAREERAALCAAAHGEADLELPDWYWKLEVDDATLLATPRPVRR